MAETQRQMFEPGEHIARNPNPPTPLRDRAVGSLRNSELYQTWREKVVRDDDDFMVVIAPSSKTGRSGTGKTTLAVTLARLLSNNPEGFSAEDHASLSSHEVAQDLIPNTATGSAIIFDEAQGTLSGSGVDTRRAMADSVVNMSKSAAQFRKRQHTLIIVTQATDWLDSRMMDMMDRLLLIQERNPARGWARAVSFSYRRNDLNISGGTNRERTPAKEDIIWRPLPDDDPDYQEMDRMKEAASGGSDPDDDTQDAGIPESLEEMPKNVRDAVMRDLSDAGVMQKTICEITGLEKSTVSRIVRDLD